MRLGRIRGRADIDDLRSSPLSARSGALRVVMAPPAPGGESEARLAFALPRRVGTAVHRNRVRRQLREVFRRRCARDAVAPGRYLVVVSPGVGEPSSAALEADVERALLRLDGGRGAPRAVTP